MPEYNKLSIESFAYDVATHFIHTFKELEIYVYNVYESYEKFYLSEKYVNYYKNFYDDYYNLTNYELIKYNIYDRLLDCFF